MPEIPERKVISIYRFEVWKCLGTGVKTDVFAFCTFRVKQSSETQNKPNLESLTSVVILEIFVVVKKKSINRTFFIYLFLMS